MKRSIVVFGLCVVLLASASSAFSQQYKVLPMEQVQATVENGDTLLLVRLPAFYVYAPIKFKNKKQERFFWKQVRDVKRTLPYAKMVYATLVETYEFIQTLPTEEDRREHLKRMEKELFEQYKPELKKFTYSQGKLLIRLIDRECNQTSYELIKAFLGPFRAGVWQTFGALFGVSLRREWDPEGKDAVLERIVRLVEQGAL